MKQIISGRFFRYANNSLTIAGFIITTSSALAILVFLFADLSSGFHNPYLGIFAYVILPVFFFLGLVLFPVGMWLRFRKFQKLGIDPTGYPKLDFNESQFRRAGLLILALTCVNLLILGVSSYMAVEKMDTVEFCGTTCHTVMQPEFTAYQNSPHSRVRCVQCHIGPGASWFVRSKIDGLRQVWKTALGSYHRPIETPVHNLRPARETCEQCHWPEKHHGDKLKVFATFAEDQSNTPSYTAMILKTGGGELDVGRHGGIHWWHIYSDNRIRYYSSDEQRQDIIWVELKTPDGELRSYSRPGRELPSEAALQNGARVMDCIDCHNRPTHLFKNPDRALDELLENHPEYQDLPFFKKTALAAVSAGFETRDDGIQGVRQAILDYYRNSNPDLLKAREKAISEAAGLVAEVYGRSNFPEMKTNWETHPLNIGHQDFPGCWRCHDDEMKIPDGTHTIPQDCDTCHVFLTEDSREPPDFESLVQ